MSKYKVGDTFCINGEIKTSREVTAKTYEDGLADAWEAARKICCDPSDEGILAEEISTIFGTDYPPDVIIDHTPQEAIAKIKEWEDGNEIRWGDEVEHRDGKRGIVIHTGQSPFEGRMIRVLWENNLHAIAYNKGEAEQKITKTGRNFADKLDALLGEIGGDTNG